MADSLPIPSKPPKVIDAEITEDGDIIIRLNQKVPKWLNARVILTGDLIWSLAQEYSDVPPVTDTDFPGIPMVDADDVFNDEEEESTHEIDDPGEDEIIEGEGRVL